MSENNINKYIYSVVFATMPIINMIRKILIGQAYKLTHYITLLIPVLIHLSIGYFIISYFNEHEFSNKNKAAKIGVLVGIDQIAKVVIYNFLGSNVINLGNLYAIKIVKNEQVTAFFNILGLTLPSWIITIMRFMVLILMLILFKQCEKKYHKDSYLNLAKIFIYSMLICSLVDSTLWGYTLDFIILKDLQAIDIKDIYAQFGIGLFLIYSIKNGLIVTKKYNGKYGYCNVIN